MRRVPDWNDPLTRGLGAFPTWRMVDRGAAPGALLILSYSDPGLHRVNKKGVRAGMEGKAALLVQQGSAEECHTTSFP
jgi:hypothetical protein